MEACVIIADKNTINGGLPSVTMVAKIRFKLLVNLGHICYSIFALYPEINDFCFKLKNLLHYSQK